MSLVSSLLKCTELQAEKVLSPKLVAQLVKIVGQGKELEFIVHMT
jgi:hypothetical protein